MLPFRLSAAFLCALFIGGGVLGTVPSCGRKATSQVHACCRNEATCPMHKQSSGALGVNACQGDSTDATTVRTYHRAVLTAGVSTIAVPRDNRRFETTEQFPQAVSLVPGTPPPRRG